MARKKVSNTKKQQGPKFTVSLPPHVYESIRRAAFDSKTSIAALCRDVVETGITGTMGQLLPEPGWNLVTIYCDEEVHQRAVKAVAASQQPTTERKGKGRPRGGFAATVAWVIAQRYGQEGRAA